MARCWKEIDMPTTVRSIDFLIQRGNKCQCTNSIPKCVCLTINSSLNRKKHISLFSSHSSKIHLQVAAFYSMLYSNG